MSVLVSGRGQITIPKSVREYLDLSPGVRVDFEIGPNGRVFLVKLGEDSETGRSSCYFGYVKGDMTTDQIMALLRGES